MVWSRRLVPALAACCALGAGAAGQPEFDVRPIYYAMLEVVESSFSAHSERIEEAYRASREALERSVARDLRQLEVEGEEIERARQDGEAAFEAERSALNARIDAVNEAVRHIESNPQGATAAIELYREAYERVLDELRAARASHRELSAGVRARREALDEAARAYRDGTSEDAREIARLDRAYRRFAAQVMEAFREREAALRLEREELRTWLPERIEALQRAERELAPLAEQYAALEDDHDRAQRELNRRIETYNERVRAAGEAGTRRDELAALRDEIDARRELLDGHRGRAIVLVREIGDRRAALQADYEAFQGEREEREQTLRLRTRALATEGQEIAALVEARRAGVQAQIAEVEDRIRAGLGALRAEVEAAEHRLEEELGSAPAALLAAAAKWTETLDPALLYDTEGAPRFERSPPRNAALYDALDAARGLVEGARGALGRQLVTVQRQRAEIAGERESLVERHGAFTSALADRRSRWEARLDAAKETSRRLEGALAGHFEGRIALAALELRALQGALLDVLGTPAAALPEPGEREHLQASVSEKGAILATAIEVPAVPADPLVEGFAAMGRDRDPEVPDLEWQRLSAGSFPREDAPEAHALEGEGKRRLLAAWYRRLDTVGALDPLAHRLSLYFPSHSAANLEDALYGLFHAGMLDAAGAVRYRWSEGKPAYQVRILERRYWIQPDGRLLLAPLTW